MSKSVLVLEENLAIQGLIASSLPPDLLSLHQESDPESFLQQARALKPDLIFVSNEDRSRGYQTLRQIREDQELSSTPQRHSSNRSSHHAKGAGDQEVQE